jgi:hypothetical protein
MNSTSAHPAESPLLMPLPLVISRIGPESDVLLRNLFEHYCHDMSEWFDFDTTADGSYSHDTSSIWALGISGQGWQFDGRLRVNRISRRLAGRHSRPGCTRVLCTAKVSTPWCWSENG